MTKTAKSTNALKVPRGNGPMKKKRMKEAAKSQTWITRTMFGQAAITGRTH
jgi:hypothetical protein